MLNEIPNLRRHVWEDPCYPIYGELIRMLEQDMTVEEAIREHCKNFGFANAQSDWEHEIMHLLLGFAFLKLGTDPFGLNFSYQNNSVSEAFTIAWQDGYISDYIESTTIIDKDLTERVIRSGAKCRGTEFDAISAGQKNSLKTVDLLRKAMRQGGRVGSYLELLTLNEHVVDQMEACNWDVELEDFEIEDIEIPEIKREDVEAIFKMMPEPLLYIIQLLRDHEAEKGAAFARDNPNLLNEEANAVMGKIKMRTLWDLMPITDREPIFPFSRKGRMQSPQASVEMSIT